MAKDGAFVFVLCLAGIVASPANISLKCLKDTMDYLSDLNSNEPQTYAFLMYDALGKPASGITNGNVDRLGSYSECLSVQAPQQSFQGEYCKLHVEQDGIQFVIGICVPDSCNNRDITLLASMDLFQIRGTSFLASLPNFVNQNETGFIVAETVCSRGLFPADSFAIICLCLSGLLIILPVIGSIYTLVLNFQTSSSSTQCKPILSHRKQRTEEQDKPAGTSNSPLDEDYRNEKTQIPIDRVMKSFAIQENLPAVMTVTAHQEYPALNGIRVLSLLWIISGHTSQLASVFNIDNPFEWRSRVLEKPVYLYTLSGPVYLGVDSFFFLSGFLGAKSFLNVTEQSGNEVTLAMMMRYVYKRLRRLQPLHLATIPLSIGLISLVKWGAFWELPKHQWDSCRRVWWANILLITNFVSVSDSCVGWAWYLSNDFQFHLTTPLLILLYVKVKRVTLAVVALIFLACTVTTTLLSFFLKLSIRYPRGESQSRMNYWVEYYTKPYCRYGPFLVGIIFAIMISNKQSTYIKNRTHAVTGWLSALLIMVLVITLAFVLDDSPSSYSIMAALYQGVHRSLWAVALALILILCHEGYGGHINKMLSCSIWSLPSRISYACYMVHPIIIILYCGLQETLFHYQDINMFYLFVGHSVLTFIAGLVLTVLIERPFQQLLLN